jgi:hypothetical protein
VNDPELLHQLGEPGSQVDLATIDPVPGEGREAVVGVVTRLSTDGEREFAWPVDAIVMPKRR